MIGLTKKQRYVVTLIAKSYTRAEIAALLNASVYSISEHRNKIKKKLGFNDPAALTRYAYRTGLITLDE